MWGSAQNRRKAQRDQEDRWRKPEVSFYLRMLVYLMKDDSEEVSDENLLLS